jgi:hypothetical protein
MNEINELLCDWRAVYGELFPSRDPQAMQYSDALAAGMELMDRKIALLHMKIKHLGMADAE